MVSDRVGGFDRKVLEAAAREREVTLTLRGRKTGRMQKVTIWISTDGRRLFVRSGGGLDRQWPRNFLAGREATLGLGGQSIQVIPRHVTDEVEAREISAIVRDKYGQYVKSSRPGEPLTPGEQATFELLAAS